MAQRCLLRRTLRAYPAWSTGHRGQTWLARCQRRAWRGGCVRLWQRSLVPTAERGLTAHHTGRVPCGLTPRRSGEGGCEWARRTGGPPTSCKLARHDTPRHSHHGNSLPAFNVSRTQPNSLDIELSGSPPPPARDTKGGPVSEISSPRRDTVGRVCPAALPRMKCRLRNPAFNPPRWATWQWGRCKARSRWRPADSQCIEWLVPDGTSGFEWRPLASLPGLS